MRPLPPKKIMEKIPRRDFPFTPNFLSLRGALWLPRSSRHQSPRNFSGWEETRVGWAQNLKPVLVAFSWSPPPFSTHLTFAQDGETQGPSGERHLPVWQ